MWKSGAEMPAATGLRSDIHQVLITTVFDASPDHRQDIPGASIYPFLAAVAVCLGIWALIYTPWAFVATLVISAVPFTGWFWHSTPETEREW
jgi:cytochrome c oxidase subunit 1